jgi:hydrogenase maturation protease
MVAPFLVLAIGNESRGDDALAPLLVRQLEREGIDSAVEVIEDYQLQVEHVTDLAGRTAVLFVDADMSCTAPFHFSEITATRDDSYTSHAMTPSALLHTYRQVYGKEAPCSLLMRIRGYEFELGESVSKEAVVNLGCAIDEIRCWLACRTATPSPR